MNRYHIVCYPYFDHYGDYDDAMSYVTSDYCNVHIVDTVKHEVVYSRINNKVSINELNKEEM